MTNTLPPGYSFRAPTMDDAQAVADLIRTSDIFETGSSDFTVGLVRDDWSELDLPNSALIVIAPDGLVIGCEDVYHNAADAPYHIDGYVHPEHMNLGIGSFMVERIEALIRQRQAGAASHEPMTIHADISDGNEIAHGLFRGAGYSAVRYFYRMKRELNGQPPAPHWPDGISVRSFVAGQDEQTLYTAINEAFQDHWGHHMHPYNEWVKTRIFNDGYAPELILMAFDGDEIAGSAMCYERGDDGGWVRNLGVRRPWRRAGLGMALLLESFNRFYDRGRTWVGLGVDAASPTGATRLYERAGMAVTERAAKYEKVINTLS